MEEEEDKEKNEGGGRRRRGMERGGGRGGGECWVRRVRVGRSMREEWEGGRKGYEDIWGRGEGEEGRGRRREEVEKVEGGVGGRG